MVDRTTSGHKAKGGYRKVALCNRRTGLGYDCIRTPIRYQQVGHRTVAGYDKRYAISRTRSTVGYHTVGMEIVRTEHQRKNVRLLG